MNLLQLTLKNILHRPWQAVLSILLLALGVGLMSVVWQVQEQAGARLQKSIQGIDMVLGAKGSPLQLILSAVLHIDNPTGNIQLSEAERIQKHPLVQWSIPLSYGDSYRGYRVVGTDTSYLGLYGARIERGGLWTHTMEVVLGSEVAKALTFNIGDEFASTHGLSESGHAHEEQLYKVVGILSPSHSVIDQLILCSTASIWAVHQKEPIEEERHEEHEHGDHEHEHTDEDAHQEEPKEITALLVKFKSPAGAIMLPRAINENTSMQAAVPSYQVERLIGLMGIGIKAVQVLAGLILIVSGISVFIGLYNTLRERKYELALLRCYGASPLLLFRLIVQEGLTLSLMGGLIGLLLSRVGLWAFSQIERSANLEFALLSSFDILIIVATIAIGFLASLIPAIQALKVDIGATLQEEG